VGIGKSAAWVIGAPSRLRPQIGGRLPGCAWVLESASHFLSGCPIELVLHRADQQMRRFYSTLLAARGTARHRNKTFAFADLFRSRQINRSTKTEMRNVEQDHDCFRNRPYPRLCFRGSGRWDND